MPLQPINPHFPVQKGLLTKNETVADNPHAFASQENPSCDQKIPTYILRDPCLIGQLFFFKRSFSSLFLSSSSSFRRRRLCGSFCKSRVQTIAQILQLHFIIPISRLDLPTRSVLAQLFSAQPPAHSKLWFVLQLERFFLGFGQRHSDSSFFNASWRKISFSTDSLRRVSTKLQQQALPQSLI